MQFVKIANLKVGMRIARPIYNKNGVLLFERDSKLTSQAIASIANFGLIGLFILEPAEPVPPMTKEDIEFERYQTMSVFALQEELQHIMNNKRAKNMQSLVFSIVKNYGHLDKKINFIQNIRSREDYIFKHSINVAILCSMMTHIMNTRVDEIHDIITAALLHDIGKLSLPASVKDVSGEDLQTREAVRLAEISAYPVIENVIFTGTAVRRICMQSQRTIEDMFYQNPQKTKVVNGAKILAVADMFDTLTAMKSDSPPMSEVSALKFLMERPDYFDPMVVDALIKSINILKPGTSVELSTGEKALVIRENENDVLRPMLLSFRDNSIIDLADRKMFSDISIVDIMRTLDNRHIIDVEALKRAGFHVNEEYV